MSIHSIDSSLLFFRKIFFNCLDQRFSVPYFGSFIQRYQRSAFHISCHFLSLILFNPSFMSNFFFSLSSSEFFCLPFVSLILFKIFSCGISVKIPCWFPFSYSSSLSLGPDIYVESVIRWRQAMFQADFQ